MWFIKFYVISTVIAVFVVLITTAAIANEYKRVHPGRKYEKNTASEKIRSWLPVFVPFFNIILTAIYIFGAEGIKANVFKRLDETTTEE